MNAQEIYQRVCSCAAISKEVVSCALYVVSVVHGEKRVEVDTVIQVINTFGKGSELSLEIHSLFSIWDSVIFFLGTVPYFFQYFA